MLRFIAQPYPVVDDSKKMTSIISLIVFLFVFFFLVVFRPFNIDEALTVHIYLASFIFAAFGTLCYIGYVKLTLKLFPNRIVNSKWTIGKEFLYINGLLFFISLGNTVIRNFIAPTAEQSLMGNIFSDLYYTYSIGLFPVALSITIRYIILLKRNNLEVHVDEKSIETSEVDQNMIVRINSKDQNDFISIPIDQLMYLKSNGNYVEFYLREDDQINRYVQRNTLGYIEEQITHEYNFFRTHRKYIVNLDKIIEANGNAQGYKLILPEVSEDIPVSRNKLIAFKARMEN